MNGNRGRPRYCKGAVSLALLLILLAGCSSSGPTQPEAARPVKTMIVAAGGELHTRLFPGMVEASKRVELAFQVPGVLVMLPVREGQRVKKGELIAQLRPDEFQARLKTLQGQLDQARAQLQALRAGDRPEQRLRLEAQVRAAAARMANARAEYERDARLVRSNAVSREEFERAKTSYRLAQEEHTAAMQSLEKGTIAREEDVAAQEAVVRGLEGRVVEANLQLSDATLVAPYDGVVAQRFVELNQNVRAKEPIVRFQDVEEIEVAVEVVREVVAENQWPLFGATAIGVIAFAAIGLSEDSTGEYTNSLFWVILIALTLSWVSSVTGTPLLSYRFFKPLSGRAAGTVDAYSSLPFRVYRNLLTQALRHRWAVVAGFLIAFAASLYGFTRVDQSFFPPATRPQFMVDVFLPASTHIRETEAFAADLQRFIQQQPGVTHVTSFIGGGGLRFLLVYSPERENRAFVQFLIDIDDPAKMDGLIALIQEHLDAQQPNANGIAKKFLLGPGQGGRIQARFRGPDPAQLRLLGDQARQILQDDGGAVCVRSDWRERVQAIRPDLLEFQARRNGITRVEVAQALASSFEGRGVGFYREPGYAAAGVFPQETRLLPIVARPPLTERADVSMLGSLQIWSPVAGRMIPLSQVTRGAEVVWEDPVVMRRDRFPTLTVHADPRFGLPSQLHERVRGAIEQIELPPGYALEWGGEDEDSRQARGALAAPLPYVLALMVFIVVCLFNSIRITLLIWLVMPLVIIGVTTGLLLTGKPFGFMALLGVLALGGELIKNQIVVLSKILTEIGKGKPPYQAIVEGSTSKMRPVCMVVLTTVLGMIPLLKDPFFGAMAVCIMFGLSLAAVLSLLVTPVLYAIFFNIHEPAAADAPAE